MKTNPGKRLLLLVLVFVSLSAQANLETRLDRTTVFEGESVNLIIGTQGMDRQQEPDLSPLYKDFEVLGNSSSTQLNIVNGRQSMNTQWQISLLPRRVGNIQVPALTIGNLRSESVSLTVRPAASSQTGEDQEIFMEATISETNPYVQQQLVYTLKIFHASQLLEGALGAPQGNDIVVERLGDDLNYESVRGSTRYRVIERRYALFPQKSGPLILPPVPFEGRIASGNNYNRFFDRGRRIRLDGETKQLDVRPRPDNWPAGAPWLPSTSILLKESWPDGAPSFRAGEPVTRSLMLTAEGLMSSQLPELELPIIQGLQHYPDQPVLDNHFSTQGIQSSREEKYALVPSESGQLELPRIQLPWWNVKTDTLEYAEIPARSINVQPAIRIAGTQNRSPQLPLVTPNTRTEPIGDNGENNLYRYTTVAFALLWLATLAYHFKSRKSRPGSGKQAKSRAAGNENERKAFLQACRQSEPAQCQKALLALARKLWPGHQLLSLGELSEHLEDQQLAEEIRLLEKRLYSGRQEESWNADKLAAAFKKTPAIKASSTAKTSQLPPLYPESMNQRV